MPAPFTAPRTPFNSTITGHRAVAFAQLELADVKAVKNAFGVKVNDVVMTLVASALRSYLAGRGELPDSPLVGMVPVSVHEESDRPGRNQVSAMFAGLHTHIEDPVERLRALADANEVAKDHNAELGANMLQDWSQFMGAAVFGVAVAGDTAGPVETGMARVGGGSALDVDDADLACVAAGVVLEQPLQGDRRVGAVVEVGERLALVGDVGVGLGGDRADAGHRRRHG